MPTNEALKPGYVRWHSTEAEGASPDVGIELQIDHVSTLWAGEISRARWEEAGGEALGLGQDGGWWLILYEGQYSTVLGKLIDESDAREAIDRIGDAIRRARARH